jgi:di/tricarboxylate transporter
VADSTIVFLVLGGLVVLFVVDLLPSEVVALSSAVALWASGVLDVDQALAGFGNPTVIFVASLLVVAAALDATGLTAWAGQILISTAGRSQRRLTVATMMLCALLTALITVHGAVAALIPVVVATAIGVDVPPSRLLLPLAFAAHAGSQLTLTGSQVNILYSDAAHDAGAGYFGFFEYTLVGVPLLVGTVVIVAALGPRLLPDRTPSDPPVGGRGRSVAPVDPDDDQEPISGPLFDRRAGTAEIVIPAGSALIGTSVRPGRTPQGRSVVLVVHRDGGAVRRGPTVLAAGDVLLLHGDWRALGEDLRDEDVLVVDEPEQQRRHVVPWGHGARRTVVVLAAFVVLLATGAMPPPMAALLAAGVLVVSGAIRIDDAYRGIEWTTVVLIAGMIPLSTAMTASGAADDLADAITRIVGDGGPYLLLTVLFVVVAALGQVMSNTATALVAIPVGVAAAADLDVSVRPVLMSLNVVTVAALLTPVATAANTMVLRPGGYRFGDYARLGLPLLVWWFVIAVGLVPLVWRF